MQQIVIIHEDPEIARTWARRLEGAGYQAAAGSTLQEGKLLLAIFRPSLLITTQRLGAFNGLHLVIRGRSDDPQMLAVVLCDGVDPSFAAECSKHGAICMSGRLATDELPDLVNRMLSQDGV